MKKITHLIGYILLVFTLFIIPVNSTAFNINFANILAPTDDDALTQLPNKVSITQLDSDADLARFAIDSSQPLGDEALTQLNVDLELTDFSGQTKQYKLDDLDYSVESSGLRRDYRIHALKDQSVNPYHNNHYNFNITLFDAQLDLMTSTWQAHSALSANGKTAEQVKAELFPIYYMDQSKRYNIPVYTTLEPAGDNFRRYLYTLAKLPSYHGISADNSFPKTSYVWFSSGKLELRFIEPNLTAYNNPNIAKLVLDNLLKTYAVQNREYTVNKIELKINNNQTSKAFGNIDISKPFTVDRTPKVFLPYIQDDQLSWVPFNTVDSDDYTTLANSVINAYINPYNKVKSADVVALLPEKVALDNVQVVANTLKLTFNQTLLDVFKGHDAYAQCFIEGLTLSVSTMPFIDNLEIYVNQDRLEQLGNYKFTSPINRPLYYNVDPAYISQ